MPRLAIIESSETEIFGSKITNRNNHNIVISTVKSTHIDYSNEKESDSGSDNGSICYIPPKNTDIASVKILGPNITDREILPGIEFPRTIDSDEDESDSDSDDGKVFLVDDKSIELIGCQNNFTTATMNFVKKPLQQRMSTASDTSTNYNLNIDNHNSWIGSSSSSESECEDDSKDIEKKENEREDEITKGLEKLNLMENKNSVKNSELKIINTLDNVDDLSLQTSKMNINFSNNDEKNFICKERKLSKNLPVKNYHTSRNGEKDFSESEDSDASDDETDSGSENDDWIPRGIWPKKGSTGSTPNSKNIERTPYDKCKPTIEQKTVEKRNGNNVVAFGTGFGKMTTHETTMNSFSNSWYSSGTGQCQNTGNYGDLEMSVKNDQRYTVNQYPIPYPSPTISEYTPSSSYDSPQSSEGYHSLSNGDCEENFRLSSPTPTNVQSTNNALDNLTNHRGCINVEDSYAISNGNMNMVPEYQDNLQCQNQVPIVSEKINSMMDPHQAMTLLAQPNLLPNNVSQTNLVKILENHDDLDLTKIIEDLIDLEEEVPNRLDNMVSLNENMFSQSQSLSYISKSPEVNQLNSDNLRAIRIPPASIATHNQGKNISTILRIDGSSDTGGRVTVKEPDDRVESIREILLHLESDLGNNYEELKQTSNSIQGPIIADNYDVGKRNNNYRPNILEVDRPLQPYNQLVQKTFENPKQTDTLIPLSVNERSQLVLDKKFDKKMQIWSSLDLPDTNACKKLKTYLNVDMILQYACEFIRLGKEKFEADGKTGDTLLTTIVSNPKKLKNELDRLVSMVVRMLHYPKTLMMKNNQGHDALYLAAINCPGLPFVTGYLAATIEKFHKKYDLKFNVYNRNNDTLMHVVAAQGDSHRSVMEELLALRKERGCSFLDPSIRNSDGKTPLHLALEANRNIPSKQNAQMVQLLMEHGADIGIRDKKGNMALHCNISNFRLNTFESISDMKRNKNNSNG